MGEKIIRLLFEQYGMADDIGHSGAESIGGVAREPDRIRVPRQRPCDKTGILNKGGFLAHRSDEGA